MLFDKSIVLPVISEFVVADVCSRGSEQGVAAADWETRSAGCNAGCHACVTHGLVTPKPRLNCANGEA